MYKKFTLLRKTSLMILSVIFLVSCGQKYTAHFTTTGSDFVKAKKEGPSQLKENSDAYNYSDELMEAESISLSDNDIAPMSNDIMDLSDDSSETLKENESNNTTSTTIHSTETELTESVSTVQPVEEMSKKEIRKTRRELRKNLLELRKEAKENEDEAVSDNLLLLIIITILIPPLGVLLAYGAGTEFLISLILTLLFFLPGLIYSLIVVLR